MKGKAPRIGDMLREVGAVTAEQIDEAARWQQEIGGRLGSRLLQLGHIDERTLGSTLARQLNVPSVTWGQLERAQPALLRLITADVAERLMVVPIREDGDRLWVAMRDPLDGRALAELATIVRRHVRSLVSPETLLEEALELHYQVARATRVMPAITPEDELSMAATIPPPSSSPTTTYEVGGEPLAAPAALGAALAEVPLYGRAGGKSYATLDAVTEFLDFAARDDKNAGRQSLDELVWRLASATTTDHMIVDLAVRFLAQDCPRVWAFRVVATGFTSELRSWTGLGLPPESVADRTLTADGVVAECLRQRAPMSGLMAPSALGSVAGVLGVERDAPTVILPLRAGAELVGVIVAVQAKPQLIERVEELRRLADKLDCALQISQLRQRLLST